MKSTRRVIVAMAAIAIVGLGSKRAQAGFCPIWACGMNSATVGDGIVFDELNVRGLTSDVGIRIRSVTLPDGTPGRLLVNGHHLAVVGRTMPIKRALRGPDLVGTIITIAHKDGRAYELKISRAVDGCGKDQPECLKFWSTPYTDVPNYSFVVKKISMRATAPLSSGSGRACVDDRPIEREFGQSICLGRELEPDLWKGVEKSGLVFEGDHYNPSTHDVRQGRKDWFNLACAGTAAAKMHLLRHTKAGSILTGPPPTRRVTSLGDRTAMLRMLTADYCGNGSAFTINGQPLLYGDVKNWYPTPPLVLNDPRSRSFEAAWGPKGPLCLTEPRRYCLAQVEAVCKSQVGPTWKLPRPCASNGPLPGTTHVISENPKVTGSPPACINQWP